jgi:hypothetical protein
MSTAVMEGMEVSPRRKARIAGALYLATMVTGIPELYSGSGAMK